MNVKQYRGETFEFRTEKNITQFYHEGKKLEGVHFSQELVQDLKAIMGFDPYEELNRIIEKELDKYIDKHVGI